MKLERSKQLSTSVSFNQTIFKEGNEAVEKHNFTLDSGEVYLIKNDIEKAYEVFADKVLSGSEGLIITREYPPKIRRKFGLVRTRIMWLSPEKDDTQQIINTLQDLSIIISDFTQKADQGIILLDGLEYLVTNNSFEAVIHFLQSKRSQMEKTGNILITPILTGALQLQQTKLIERETRILNFTQARDHFRYL